MSTDSIPVTPANGASGFRRNEFLPLRGLANLLIALVGTIGLTGAEHIFVHQRDGQGNFSYEIGSSARPLVIITSVCLAATIIVFLAWFRRARINAERFDWLQRRARAWAFWGWIIPIGNLWIPFQIMGDIWRAGLPPAQRSRTAGLVVLWWASWLLSTPPLWIRVHTSSRSANTLIHGWPYFVCFLIAGLALVNIVRTISYGPVGAPD